jgi:rhamnulokinase
MAERLSVAAVDLGGSGGRVIVGDVGPGRLELHEVHRFGNRPVLTRGTLHWDVLRLYCEILDGLRAAGQLFDLASVGVDSWGVDYGLLDATGALLGNPVHYRDARTEGVPERVLARIGADELYATTGTAQLPLNTIYQLAAAAGTPALEAARTLLLMPDLFAYWLTGQVGAEVTNASTTQLYDVRTGRWATALMERAGIPARIFPPLRYPGDTIGPLTPEVCAGSGLDRGVPVIAVGSHDTASAVAAVPAVSQDFAYISCGTWSLVGMELDGPVLTEESRLANFTNETGVDGTIRYLRNVTGLWLLQESVRAWAAQGTAPDLSALLDEAAAAPGLRSVIDAGDREFLSAGDMPARIAGACQRSGQPVPRSQAETVRCVLDSLALAHWRAIRQVQQLSGRGADVIHIVGGGARNRLLCQLTADACGLPVLAGPAEATAIGNIGMQARAHGAAPADLAGLRALVRSTQHVRRFEPSRQHPRWEAAARALGWDLPLSGRKPGCGFVSVWTPRTQWSTARAKIRDGAERSDWTGPGSGPAWRLCLSPAEAAESAWRQDGGWPPRVIRCSAQVVPRRSRFALCADAGRAARSEHRRAGTWRRPGSGRPCDPGLHPSQRPARPVHRHRD